MKFLLDVCTSSNYLRKLLADLGHDVRLAVDVDPHASDDDMLNLALQDGRVLITEDKNFGELALFTASHTTVSFGLSRCA